MLTSPSTLFEISAVRLFGSLQAFGEYGGVNTSELEFMMRRLVRDLESWASEYWVQLLIAAVGLFLFMKFVWSDAA